jgi:O-antigen ligase
MKMALKDDKGTISWNPHNQFLQTTLEIGILGGIVLIVYLVLLLRLGIRNRSGILLLITTAVIFNCMFESMYQRQSGILFFTFVISFLLIYEYQKAEGSTELNGTIDQPN